MKPMIWHPDENDTKVNRYLDRINHAPYRTIVAVLAVATCFFTFMFLTGSF
jgi:hypothetical protein